MRGRARNARTRNVVHSRSDLQRASRGSFDRDTNTKQQSRSNNTRHHHHPFRSLNFTVISLLRALDSKKKKMRFFFFFVFFFLSEETTNRYRGMKVKLAADSTSRFLDCDFTVKKKGGLASGKERNSGCELRRTKQPGFENFGLPLTFLSLTQKLQMVPPFFENPNPSPMFPFRPFLKHHKRHLN